MVMYQIYTQNEERIYRAHVCSFATVYLICSTAVCFLSPLFIAYHSQGKCCFKNAIELITVEPMEGGHYITQKGLINRNKGQDGLWLKETFYREQGDVRFKHEFLVLLYGKSIASFIGYSSLTNLNVFMDDELRIPVVKSGEFDGNNDGRKDYLTFQLDMPLQTNEEVQRVELILLFDYQLHLFSSLQMECMAYVSYDSSLSGSSLNTSGDLKLVQKEPLPHKGSHTLYNVSVIDDTTLLVDKFDFSRIFRSYKARNVSTQYEDPYPVWKIGRRPSDTFTISALVAYPEERISYRPGTYQVLKAAWIQYLAILVVFIYLFRRLNRFIFSNQLVNSVVSRKKIHTD